MSNASLSDSGRTGGRERLFLPLRRIAESPLSLMVVAVLLLAAFGSLFYLDRQLKRDLANLKRVAVNAERLLSLDNDTTNSVRLAAGLRSRIYILGYDDAVETRTLLLQDSIALIVAGALSQTLADVLITQQAIEEIERQAIGLIESGRWEEALELVTESSFKREKGIYRAGLSGALRQLLLDGEAVGRNTDTLRVATQGFVLVAYLLLALLGLSYSQRIRRALAREVVLHDGLRQANAELERRVEARTRELSAKETQLRVTMENMPDGMFMVEPSGSSSSSTGSTRSCSVFQTGCWWKAANSPGWRASRRSAATTAPAASTSLSPA